MTRSILLFFCLFLFSCSNVHFQSRDYAPVTTETNVKSTIKISIKGEVIFYAWGIFPDEHIVYIDDEFKKRGYSFISDPRIEEYQTFFNYLFTALSFGMYNPRNYRITAYVIKESNRYDF